ncbi:hypothetical protein Tco_1298792 [Tanacetum coccineum]
MAGNTVKEMTTNFGKLDKFEGHDFRRWQKKMHFLLTTLKVVYVLTTPMPELLEDATVEAIRIRAKWENDDYICRGHILNGMSDSLFDNKILKLRASQEGLAERMTNDRIMDKVLGSSRAFKPGRGRKLPNSTSSSSVCNYPSPEPLVSKSALRRFVEAHNQQMKDWHAQLADKNIELRLPAPLDPNALLEDDAEPRDAADVLEDAANVLEDAAEPGEE